MAVAILANRTTRARLIPDCPREVCYDNFQLRPSSSHSETQVPIPATDNVIAKELLDFLFYHLESRTCVFQLGHNNAFRRVVDRTLLETKTLRSA